MGLRGDEIGDSGIINASTNFLAHEVGNLVIHGLVGKQFGVGAHPHAQRALLPLFFEHLQALLGCLVVPGAVFKIVVKTHEAVVDLVL